jgi:hypothetical protein
MAAPGHADRINRRRTPVRLPPIVTIYYVRVTRRSPRPWGHQPRQQEHEEVRIEVVRARPPVRLGRALSCSDRCCRAKAYPPNALNACEKEVLSMIDRPSDLEALRLIGDWAKWLVTIETGAIAIIGASSTSDKLVIPIFAKVLGTAAIICFLISIAVVAVLLLTLPEIAQRLHPGMNIWMTRDSIVGRLFRMNTQGLAVLESLFFGLGVVFSSVLIITILWTC